MRLHTCDACKTTMQRLESLQKYHKYHKSITVKTISVKLIYSTVILVIPIFVYTLLRENKCLYNTLTYSVYKGYLFKKSITNAYKHFYINILLPFFSVTLKGVTTCTNRVKTICCGGIERCHTHQTTYSRHVFSQISVYNVINRVSHIFKKQYAEAVL